MEIRRFEVLSVHVDELTQARLNQLISELIASGNQSFFANQNLHSIYLYHHSEALKQYYDTADYILIDGMPIIYAAKTTRVPLSVSNRISFLDWIPVLFDTAAREGWRIFYLGSKPETLAKGLQKIRERHPTLQIQGAHGYFGDKNESVLGEIAAFNPHILFVGMGMPLEERWVLENKSAIKANAVFIAGSTMDYLAGEVPTPPRWLGPLCLEWLFRLVIEPKRLWRRYLLEPWFIVRMCLLSPPKDRN